MKKRIIHAIAIGVLISQLTPYTAYATGTVNENLSTSTSSEIKGLITPNKEEMIPVVFSPETTLELGELIDLLDNLEVEYSEELLNEIFSRMFELNTLIPVSDVELHKEYDQIHYIMYKAIYYGMTNMEGEYRDNYFVKLADDMYLSSLIRHNEGTKSELMITFSQYLSFYLEDNFGEYAQKILIYLNSMLFRLSNISFVPPEDYDGDYDYTLPEDELPTTIKPEQAPEPPDIFQPEEELPPTTGNDDKDDVVVPDDGDITFPNEDEETQDNNFTTDEYVIKGGQCIKVTTTYNYKGEVIDTKETILPSDQKGFCGLYDYEVENGDSWNENNNGDTALEVWEGLGLNELNKLNNYSIHYTLLKEDENPFYYDSGIRLSTDSTATYTQLRDVLNQIALKVEGYLIEDKDKLLFISEGKPLVLKDRKVEYTKEEIEDILKSFTQIGMKVDKVSQFSSESIEEQAEKGELKEITFGEEVITLAYDPIVEDGVLKLPIEDLASKIGFSVGKTDNTLTLTKEDSKFEYEIGTKNLTINETPKILSTSSTEKDGVVYGEMALVLSEIGYTLKYDSTTSTIEILK